MRAAAARKRIDGGVTVGFRVLLGSAAGAAPLAGQRAAGATLAHKVRGARRGIGDGDPTTRVRRG